MPVGDIHHAYTVQACVGATKSTRLRKARSTAVPCSSPCSVACSRALSSWSFTRLSNEASSAATLLRTGKTNSVPAVDTAEPSCCRWPASDRALLSTATLPMLKSSALETARTAWPGQRVMTPSRVCCSWPAASGLLAAYEEPGTSSPQLPALASRLCTAASQPSAALQASSTAAGFCLWSARGAAACQKSSTCSAQASSGEMMLRNCSLLMMFWKDVAAAAALGCSWTGSAGVAVLVVAAVLLSIASTWALICTNCWRAAS
mmetsp:Transcript_12595/g.27215  ORF Transcript_12595/g.27215 Transcript_12595/m.27215 type:complete len:262 (+) Transcript_12595:522-1307(+)